jgi:hypothetical protein
MSLRARALLYLALALVSTAPAIDQALSGHWGSAILGSGLALGCLLAAAYLIRRGALGRSSRPAALWALGVGGGQIAAAIATWGRERSILLLVLGAATLGFALYLWSHATRARPGVSIERYGV